MMLHVADDKFIQSETDYDKIFDKKKEYDFIYVSIGSRIYDEADSNAYHQMFPGFLKDKKTLIIIIDEFHELNKFPEEPNAKAILSYKKENDATIYVINQLFAIEKKDPDQETFRNLYETLIKNLEDIDPEKYIIASYIRFRLELNDKSDENKFYIAYINDLLSFFTKYNEQKYNKYSRNFYIWAGYNLLYLKNCIYSLQFLIDNPQFEFQYRLHKELKGGFLQSIISKVGNLNPKKNMNCSNINKLYEALKNINEGVSSSTVLGKGNIKIANLFINFCKNAIDITCEKADQKNNLHLMSDDVLLLEMVPTGAPSNSVLKGGRRKQQSTIRKHRKYKIKTTRKLHQNKLKV